jgi:glycosyltransferase involved in cell wall biosynthesis
MRDKMASFMPETIVMIATSYPRFAGDTVGTFMEPIAHSVVARGHTVHVVLPWHPRLQRENREGNVFFHPFRYAPHPSLNIFGYAEALEADVRLRWKAFIAAPLALAAAWRTARRVAAQVHATVMHGHWIIPGGVIAANARAKLPLVISLHGSDVFVAERHAIAAALARRTFARAGWVTACSADLRRRAIALGASEPRSEVLPYGVDAERFRPNTAARARVRAALGVSDRTPVVFAVGRFVRKKGFEYLIDAATQLTQTPTPSDVLVVLAGDGDLREELQARARHGPAADRIRFVGRLLQHEVADYLAAADIAVVPSVRDDAGNVDGLPNVVMETLASATPLIATPAGGISSVIDPERTGLLVPERDAPALARAIDTLASNPNQRAALGTAARKMIISRYGWPRVAERLEAAYAAAKAANAARPPR